jgi:hypothetical protein
MTTAECQGCNEEFPLAELAEVELLGTTSGGRKRRTMRLCLGCRAEIRAKIQPPGHQDHQGRNNAAPRE